MAIMRGKSLVAKLTVVAKYVAFPGAMVAALVFSPPQYESSSSFGFDYSFVSFNFNCDHLKDHLRKFFGFRF